VQVYGYNYAYSTTNCYKLRAATSNVNQLIDSDEDPTAALIKGTGVVTANDQLSVFPNPAKDKATVSFTATEEGTANITITDLMGRVLFTQQIEVQAGANKVSLPLINYAPGIYFMHVADKQTAKFQIAQ
jgi:hypothetical protein